MKICKILEQAKNMEKILIEDYEYLHRFPGTGFDIDRTFEYVWRRLEGMGYTPLKCGKAGIVVNIGKSNEKKVLLRADMDGLNIREQSGLSYASINENMHACGHDMHTAMLLGAARLLRKYELKGGVRLMFQPAEEILEGAKDMIRDGVLDGVNGAAMLHVLPALPFECGTVIVSSAGVSAPSADYFTINVEGVGGHGAMPDKCISPINISAHIIQALQEIDATVTLGQVEGGTAHNIIPDKVIMRGTMRTYDENKRQEVKDKIVSISENISKSLGGKGDVNFDRGCPTLLNNEKISCHIEKTMIELLENDKVYNTEQLSKGRGPSTRGSEDFAYVSHQVPAVMIGLAAGKAEDGYEYNLHNPKVKFDTEALKYGAAVYAASAIGLLDVI